MIVKAIRAYPTTTTCEVEMDVTLDYSEEGINYSYSGYMYYDTSGVSAFSPEATFLRWEGYPSLDQTCFFTIENLKTNTHYNLMGLLKNNDLGTFERLYSEFTTFEDYSKIGYHYVENITTKSADVVVGVEVNELGGRTDNYKLYLDYSTNSPITSPTNRQEITVNTNNITEIIEKIFYLIRLKKKRKYYYKITLQNINADEEIDSVTGEFKTLDEAFKLWMYLWYKI